MRQEQLKTSTDGSIDYGYGIIGPSFSDIEKFNSLSPLKNAENGLAQDGLVAVSPESRLSEVLNFTLGKLPKQSIIPLTAVLGIVACAPSSGGKNSSETPTPTSSYSEKLPVIPIRILPILGPSYLTQGEHTWDDSLTGVKSSIDIAPKRVADCPPGARITIDEQNVVATTSGTITAVGDSDNRKDPKHSIVEITEDGTGLKFEEFHLDKMPATIKKGTHIKRGDPIGKVSCETPPGGKTTGPHVHEDVMDKDGNYIPIRGLVFSGYTVNGNTMTKPDGTIKTADKRRCDNNIICSGIRNDLVPGSNIPAVTPTPVKRTPAPTLTPQAHPVEKPTAVPNTPEPTFAIPTPEIENPWQLYTSDSNRYQWEIPSDWEITFAVPLAPSSVVYEYSRSTTVSKLNAEVFALDIVSPFDLKGYRNKIFKEDSGWTSTQTVVDPKNPPSVDPDPEGVSDLARMTIGGEPFTLLYLHSDPYHSSYIDNRIIFVRNEKVWDIRFSYDGESTREEAQIVHGIFAHILNSFQFTD